MKPVIGITSYNVKSYEMGTDRVRGLEGQDMLMTTHDYIKSVSLAGGIPIVIPVINDAAYIQEIVEIADGFLFTGGSDITPYYYNEAPVSGLEKTNPERDEFELRLIKSVLEKDKPLLGICRGLQLINCYFKGSLYQDMRGERFHSINHTTRALPKHMINHSIKIEKDSKIWKIFNEESIEVNSFHHQCVDKLADCLTVTAASSDGIIEAIENTSYSFVVGVQWHPEMMIDHYPNQLKIFDYFINYVNSRK